MSGTFYLIILLQEQMLLQKVQNRLSAIGADFVYRPRLVGRNINLFSVFNFFFTNIALMYRHMNENLRYAAGYYGFNVA